MSTVNDQHRSLDLLFSKLTLWVKEQPDIYALALVGSYARQEAKSTSDIDLVVFVDDPQKYLSDFSWAKQFGTIEKSQLEYYGKVTSLRIFYMESYEIEFGFTTLEWAAIPIDEGTKRVIKEGFKILYDSTGKLAIIIKQITDAAK